jgi:olefin beta-lactone synthetase
LSAGAPVRLSSLERFVNALQPGVEVYTPYGATEALPVSIIGSHELLMDTKKKSSAGGGVCVGRPVNGVDVAIICISDDPIEKWSESLRLLPNQIGEITVTGPTVTHAYYKRERQNREAKIYNKETGEVWHRMGDVGYFDNQGRLWMCGRKNHRVETGKETFFSLPCEAIFDSHPMVDRSALVGVSKKGQVIPVMIIQPEKHIKLSKNETRALSRTLLEKAAQYDHTRSIQTVLYHPKFPVDVRHNAKIIREKLAVWAQKKLS